ncbi:RRM domain-containing protein [Psidium guajava]|nr:RRM domain-containing protein [Psidium guajava]
MLPILTSDCFQIFVSIPTVDMSGLLFLGWLCMLSFACLYCCAKLS